MLAMFVSKDKIQDGTFANFRQNITLAYIYSHINFYQIKKYIITLAYILIFTTFDITSHLHKHNKPYPFSPFDETLHLHIGVFIFHQS